MKFIDFFAGAGGMRMGLQRAGHTCVGFCEWDKYARQSYKAIFNTEGEWENHDIRTASSMELPRADLWTYGFPCFVAGTLIKTDKGLVPIENVKLGDMVLTHKNRYKPVIQTMKRVAPKIVKIKAMGCEEIITTENHPFWARKKHNIFIDRNHRGRKFDEAEWIKAKDLTKDYYLSVPIEQKEAMPMWNGTTYYKKGLYEHVLNNLPLKNPNFWWLVGRYMGDGWCTATTRTDCDAPRLKVVVCCAKGELDEIKSKVDFLPFTVSEDRTTYKIIFSNKELFSFLGRFGKGADGKFIHSDILNLPAYFLKEFIDGYISADGCKCGDYYKISTVSRNLAYGIMACINKVYHRHCSLTKIKVAPTTIIEERTVNQKEWYQIQFKKESRKQDRAFYEDGMIYIPIKSVQTVAEERVVYNIGVEGDESYTANSVACHNCQGISVAGKQKGIGKGAEDEEADERSNLFFQIIRLLEGLSEEDRPEWLLCENVKNLLSIDRGFGFLRVLCCLDEAGYDSEWQVFNTKYSYIVGETVVSGIPQNRERVYVISHLRRKGKREVFPILRADGENIAELQQIGNMAYSENAVKNNSAAGRVYNKDGLAPTLRTPSGGDMNLALLTENIPSEACCIDAIYNNREPRITDHCPTLRADRQGVCVGEPRAVLTPDREEKRQNGRRMKNGGGTNVHPHCTR